MIRGKDTKLVVNMKKSLIFAICLASVIQVSDLSAITGTEAVAKFQGRMYSAGQMTGIIQWSFNAGPPYTGSFKYMAPNKIYIKFSSPQGKVLVANGRKLWIYDPGNNVCAVQDLGGGGSGGFAGMVNGYMGIVTSQGSGGYTLKLKNSDRTYSEIMLWLDSGFFLKKAVLKNQKGDLLKVSLSNVSFSATVMKSLFDFNVPANTQVIKNPLQVR